MLFLARTRERARHREIALKGREADNGCGTRTPSSLPVQATGGGGYKETGKRRAGARDRQIYGGGCGVRARARIQCDEMTRVGEPEPVLQTNRLDKLR